MLTRIRVTVVAMIGGLLSLSFAPASPNASADPELEHLDWMAGLWTGEIGGTAMEEYWLPPKGGVMLGLHRDVRGEGRAFFEYLRIETRPDGIVYVASPMGRGTTDFPLVSLEENQAVFENPRHDYPQRITYALEDEFTLTARIEGEEGGQQKSSLWRWEKAIE